MNKLYEEVKMVFEKYDNKRAIAAEILDVDGIEEAIIDELESRGFDFGDNAESITADKSMNGLLSAATKTLNDNLHLCDGDVCTLKDLRDAVAKIRPDWCQTPRAD